jgi:hypothetical protein
MPHPPQLMREASELAEELNQREDDFLKEVIVLDSAYVAETLSLLPRPQDPIFPGIFSLCSSSAKHLPESGQTDCLSKSPPSHFSNDGALSSPPPFDGRILGDYSEWSFLHSSSAPEQHNSSTRDPDEILEGYYGLQPPLFGDNETAFSKSTSGSSLCTHLLEVILRPDIATNQIMAAIQRVAATERLK